MALLFDANGEQITVTTADFDSINVGSLWGWVFCDTSMVADSVIFQVGAWGASDLKSIYFNQDSGATVPNIQLYLQGGTTNLNYITALGDPGYTENQWNFFCWTWTFGTGATLYTGDLNTLATAWSGAWQVNTNGSGTFGSNNGDQWEFGGISDRYFDSRIAILGVVNGTELSLTQVQAIQYNSKAALGVSNLKILWFPGLHGASTVPDMSGNGNNGSITNATVTDHVPLGPPFGLDAALPYAVAAVGRTTKNTDAFNFGQQHGMGFRMVA